jgi:putative membrane protein
MLVFYLASKILTPVSLVGIEAALWAGVVLGVVNLLIRPLLLLLTFPINLLTFGLFTLIINTWMVILVDKLTPGLTIDGFWPAFTTSLLISVINMIIGHVK